MRREPYLPVLVVRAAVRSACEQSCCVTYEETSKPVYVAPARAKLVASVPNPQPISRTFLPDHDLKSVRIC